MLGISSLFWSHGAGAYSRCLRLLILLTVPLSLAVATEIEVIGTGTGRTGSTTLHEALNLLGYKAYHMKEIMMGAASQDVKMRHLDFWFSAYDTNCSDPNTLRQLFAEGEYTSTVHAIHYPCLDRLIFDLSKRQSYTHAAHGCQSLARQCYQFDLWSSARQLNNEVAPTSEPCDETIQILYTDFDGSRDFWLAPTSLQCDERVLFGPQGTNGGALQRPQCSNP